MKQRRPIHLFKGDRVIWVICLILAGISLIAVYSSIGYTAITEFSTTPTHAFFRRHLLYVVLAFAAAIITSKFNYQLLSRIAYPLIFISIALLLLLLFLNSRGIIHNGRWLSIPKTGFSFQPSEIAKLSIIILTARTIAIHHKKLTNIQLFWACFVPLIIIGALILPENLSTVIILYLTGMIMMYLGGIKLKHILLTSLVILLLGSGALFLSYKLYHSDVAPLAKQVLPYRVETWVNRIDNWNNHDNTELSQENMARMAVAEGGMLRFNIGGTVHARLMTQANNDFIYAIIVEETGSLVGFIIFLLYSVFFYRCMLLAYNSGRRFGGLLIIGIASSIYIQAIVHMLVCVGAIPVTGQPLPLISTGGTSYMMTLFGIGIIQSVASKTIERRKQSTPDPQHANTPTP